MDLINLTEFIVKSIVEDSESVEVKELQSEEDNTITIKVLVNESDMGKVIGKNGNVINSIRTLVQESSSLKENKFVKIKIDKK